MKMRDFYQREYRLQRQWIAQHGGTLAGYVAIYGSANDPEHYGDGGEAIFAADMAALERLRARAFRNGENTETIPFALESVQALKSPCPTCGCQAYDGDPAEDTPVAQFIRRLAWAASALDVSLKAKFKSDHGKIRLVAIDLKEEA